MTSSPRLRPRLRLLPVTAALATAGLLLPAAGGTASAVVPTPTPSESAPAPLPADVVAPTLTVTPTDGVGVDAALLVTFSEPVTGVASGTLRLRSTPSAVTPSGDGMSYVLKAARPLYAGAAYVVEASPKIVDAAGNGYVPLPVRITASSLVDDRSAVLRLLGSWTRLAASRAEGGSYVRSVPTPTRWSVTHTDVFGAGAEIRGCVGPGNGIFEVWADGRKLGRVDTYSPSTSCGVRLATAGFVTGSGLHLLELRGMGAKRAASSGTAIAVDAVRAMP